MRVALARIDTTAASSPRGQSCRISAHMHGTQLAP
jgi:hypothetical protein